MDRLREQVNAQKGRKSTQDYLDKTTNAAAAAKAQEDAEELARAREEIAALQAADSELQAAMGMGSTLGSMAATSGDGAASGGGGETGLAITRTALQIGSSVGGGSGSGSGSRAQLDATQRIN